MKVITKLKNKHHLSQYMELGAKAVLITSLYNEKTSNYPILSFRDFGAKWSKSVFLKKASGSI